MDKRHGITIDELRELKDLLTTDCSCDKSDKDNDDVLDSKIEEAVTNELDNRDLIDEDRVSELVDDAIQDKGFLDEGEVEDKIQERLDDFTDDTATKAELKKVSDLLDKIIKLNKLKVK